jgi:hypothetical protein
MENSRGLEYSSISMSMKTIMSCLRINSVGEKRSSYNRYLTLPSSFRVLSEGFGGKASQAHQIQAALV